MKQIFETIGVIIYGLISIGIYLLFLYIGAVVTIIIIGSLINLIF